MHLFDELDAVLPAPRRVISVAPVGLSAPGRPHDLEVRVSAPDEGERLPVVVFSHGNGWSHDGYAPLTSFWASRGFVVVQPTHLDSRRFGIPMTDPRFAEIWWRRRSDLVHVLDQLATVEHAVPGLSGRVDPSRIAVAGHSWGGQTAQMLLGARIVDADGTVGPDLSDARVTAGVLLATTGAGGADLHPFAAEHFPFMNPSFAELTAPTLVVAGDRDQSRMSSRGPDWFTDAYRLSPGATDLLTLFGGEHMLGGISGYEVAETTDENPERVGVVQRLTTAYLAEALGASPDAWSRARGLFGARSSELGSVETRAVGRTVLGREDRAA